MTARIRRAIRDERIRCLELVRMAATKAQEQAKTAEERLAVSTLYVVVAGLIGSGRSRAAVEARSVRAVARA